MVSADDIVRQIAALKGRLTTLDRERTEITSRLTTLEHAAATETDHHPSPGASRVTRTSSTAEKLSLFRSLFRGM